MSEENTSPSAWKDWRIWLGIFISGTCLWWALKDADWPAIYVASKNINWLILIGCAPLFVLILILRAYRWTFFIENDKASTRLKYDCLNIGFMVTNILPLRIGEFVRAAVFAKKTNRSIVEVVATIATERVFDLIALGLIAVTVVPFLPVEGFLMVVQDKVQESCSLQDGTLNFTKNGLLYLCGGGVVALLGGFLLFCKFGRGFLAWFAQRMDLKDSKFVSFANSFFDGLDTPIKNKSLIKVILISVVTWVAICLANYAVLFAFPVGETNLGQVAGLAGAVFFELVICAAIAMPSVPGFVGVWQVAAKLAFIPYGEGVPGMDDGVLAFALVFHIFMYALTIIVGAHSAYNQRVSWNMIQNLLKGKSDDAGKE